MRRQMTKPQVMAMLRQKREKEIAAAVSEVMLAGGRLRRWAEQIGPVTEPEIKVWDDAKAALSKLLNDVVSA